MLQFFLNLFSATSKENKPLVIDPSDIEYCPVKQDLISPRKYVKQKVFTTLPPAPASFNEVFTNVHEQLRKNLK